MIFDVLLGPARKLSGIAKQWLIDWVRGGSTTASGEAINEQSALTVAASGVLQSPNALSDQAYDRLKKAADGKSQAGNMHRSLIVEEGATWAATNMKPDDLQAIEARRFGTEEIARIFRISLR